MADQHAGNATGAPSYPFPSSVNVANFVKIALTSKNYMLWEAQVLSLIDSYGFSKFLEGSIPPPLNLITVLNIDYVVEMISNLQFESWKRSDTLLKGWIIDMLSEEVLIHVVKLETSVGVWKALKKTFVRSLKERELGLQKQLRLIKRDKFVVLSELLNKFKSLCDELDAIGKQVEDSMKSFWLLNGVRITYFYNCNFDTTSFTNFPIFTGNVRQL